jgi:hypothetical protein
MSNLLEDLKESISETQHTIIKLSREDYIRVEEDLFMYIWSVYNEYRHNCYRTFWFNTSYHWETHHTTSIRIVVCKEYEIEHITKMCTKPTTFINIKES